MGSIVQSFKGFKRKEKKKKMEVRGMFESFRTNYFYLKDTLRVASTSFRLYSLFLNVEYDIIKLGDKINENIF